MTVDPAASAKHRWVTGMLAAYHEQFDAGDDLLTAATDLLVDIGLAVARESTRYTLDGLLHADLFDWMTSRARTHYDEEWMDHVVL